jgi:hypothetical protein
VNIEACVVHPPGPCETIVWVRYSPIASIVFRTGPPPRENTIVPFGAFHPAAVDPQATLFELAALPNAWCPETEINKADPSRIAVV